MSQILNFMIAAKIVVKNFIPPVLWKFTRKIWHNLKGSYSSDNIDKYLVELMPYRNGYYVDVGANDGIRTSNTALLEKRQSWSGVLIEPIPHKFIECNQNRAKTNHFFCVACVSSDYHEPYVELFYSDTMSVATNLETDVENPQSHAQQGLRFIPNQVSFAFMAPALTLNKILQQSQSPNQIDLLSIDVEGAEIEVLKGINHEVYKFKYIVVECRNFDKMISFMKSIEYEFLTKISSKDLLFKSINI